ncbi:hypothetical protein SFRURICE_015652 [Spodoptera frugiperda]|nr:hypothetical protein SFRURICE_015652 [Spodoptera frugiperda]
MQACSMQVNMQTSKQAACKQASKQHASKQAACKQASSMQASKQAACKQACSMQASMVSVTAPELRGSGGPRRIVADGFRSPPQLRLSLASLSSGGSLVAACSSARGPPRPSAPTRF